MFLAILLQATSVQPIAPVPECGPPPKGQRAWVTDADYPPEARRKRQEGVVQFTLQISAKGCPTSCEVIKSSRYLLLDQKTCELMLQRARFKPKLDSMGQPISTSWTNKMTWAL